MDSLEVTAKKFNCFSKKLKEAQPSFTEIANRFKAFSDLLNGKK